MLSIVAALTTPPEGFHAPGTEIFDYTHNCLVGSGSYCLTKISFLTLLSALIIGVLFLATFTRAQIVPRRPVQNALEAMVEFIRNGIVLDVMGPEGLPFVPFLTSLFFFVWFNNMWAMVPGIQIPTTSTMSLAALLSLIVWVTFNVVGVVKQGGWGYLKGILFPPGPPWWVYILFTPIEIVSVFIVRPLTLAVRLAANMIAGHLILAVFAVGSYYLFSHFVVEGANRLVGTFGVFAFALLVFMTAFELLVAFLQAYIFTILTAVYISSSLHAEH
jgi:F-type H+-transporting ATPase subunit a